MKRDCRFCGEEVEQDEDGDWADQSTGNPYACIPPTAVRASLHKPAELEEPLFTIDEWRMITRIGQELYSQRENTDDA